MGRDTGPSEQNPERRAPVGAGEVPVEYQDTRPNPPDGGGWDDGTTPDLVTEDDGAGVAGGSSGGSGGGSGTASHPDTTRRG